MPYFKFYKPKDTTHVKVFESVYEYDFEFENAEVFAMTWARKKMEFINYIARNWGGQVQKSADE